MDSSGMRETRTHVYTIMPEKGEISSQQGPYTGDNVSGIDYTKKGNVKQDQNCKV